MNHLFTPTIEVAAGRNLSSEVLSGLEYHELGIRHPHEANVLEELKANLAQLEDLHLRLKYLMGEIGQHTRKRA